MDEEERRQHVPLSVVRATMTLSRAINPGMPSTLSSGIFANLERPYGDNASSRTGSRSENSLVPPFYRELLSRGFIISVLLSADFVSFSSSVGGLFHVPWSIIR